MLSFEFAAQDMEFDPLEETHLEKTELEKPLEDIKQEEAFEDIKQEPVFDNIPQENPWAMEIDVVDNLEHLKTELLSEGEELS